MILCDRPCSNKSEYGYCNTTYCINPAIPNIAVGSFPPPRLIKTNADRIRSMTDEELAKFLCLMNHECYECPGDEMCSCGENGMLKWLKEDVKE